MCRQDPCRLRLTATLTEIKRKVSTIMYLVHYQQSCRLCVAGGCRVTSSTRRCLYIMRRIKNKIMKCYLDRVQDGTWPRYDMTGSSSWKWPISIGEEMGILHIVCCVPRGDKDIWCCRLSRILGAVCMQTLLADAVESLVLVPIPIRRLH